MKPSLLLHVCCAPCAIIPVEYFISDYEITLFWYNPNIHPYKEYLDRLDSVKKLALYYQLPLIEEEYNYLTLLRSMVSNPVEPVRCKECYQIRLNRLKEKADEKNIEFVSTSLLYSIYQKHEMMKELADSIFPHRRFIYQDFRTRYREGVEMAKVREYYRQKYCGCLFSNYDRYQKKRS